MRLFLSGGGSEKKSIILDKKFARELDKSKSLLYIPIAIDKAKHSYQECFKWISSIFNPLGVNSIVLWTEQDLERRKEIDLKKFSGIYIGGGNTYYLLKELKNSGFLENLKKLIEMDFPVYGGSAGAIILGKDIRTSSDENEVNLKDFSGLDLVRGYSIFCHYDKETKWAREFLKEEKLKTIALPEDCGLFVTDDKIEVIGAGSAYLPDKKTTLKPGQVI